MTIYRDSHALHAVALRSKCNAARIAIFPPDIKRTHFYLRLQLSNKQPEAAVEMFSLDNSPADEVDRSGASVALPPSASSVDMFIGSRIRSRRTSRGITQREFSKLLEIERVSLAAHEAGAKRVNAKLLFQIATLLDVRPEYFFRGYTEAGWKTE